MRASRRSAFATKALDENGKIIFMPPCPLYSMGNR
jgi:hypothetical protein